MILLCIHALNYSYCSLYCLAQIVRSTTWSHPNNHNLEAGWTLVSLFLAPAFDTDIPTEPATSVALEPCNILGSSSPTGRETTLTGISFGKTTWYSVLSNVRKCFCVELLRTDFPRESGLAFSVEESYGEDIPPFLSRNKTQWSIQRSVGIDQNRRDHLSGRPSTKSPSLLDIQENRRIVVSPW